MPYLRVKNELPIIPGYGSGSVVSFSDGYPAPLVELKAQIIATQSGTGTPSPDNVRPISGFTICTITNDGGELPDTYNIPLDDTIYGGTLDVVSGVLTIDMAMIKLKDLTYESVGSGTSARFQVYNFPQLKPTGSNTQLGKSICTTYPVKVWNTLNQSDDCYMVVNGSSSYMAIRDTRYSDATDFYNSLTDNDYLCYEMLTPTTTQLTPQEVKSLLGENIIYANTGDISLAYIRRLDS